MSADNIVKVGGRSIMVSKLANRPQINGKMTLPAPPPPQPPARPQIRIPEPEPEDEEPSVNMIIAEKPSKKVVREYFRSRVSELEEAFEEM